MISSGKDIMKMDVINIIYYQTLLHWNSITKDKNASIYMRGIFFWLLHIHIHVYGFLIAVKFRNK